MLFLRLLIFVIVALGVVIYLTAIKLRAEFYNAGDKHFEFKDFYKNPPTDYAASLVRLIKKLTLGLIAAVVVFCLILAWVAFVQT